MTDDQLGTGAVSVLENDHVGRCRVVVVVDVDEREPPGGRPVPGPGRRERDGRRVRGVTERELAALSLGDLVAVASGRGTEAEHAWKLLVERHVQVVWQVVRCFGLSKEASWEAFQSTWLRAIERLDTLRDPDSFPAWLASIARREALGVIRARNKLLPVGQMPDEASTEAPLGERLQREEVVTAVRAGFADLPRQCQDLLRLLTVDPPVPYREIERLLDMRHGSIGPTRARCLDKLRKTPAMAAFLSENDE